MVESKRLDAIKVYLSHSNQAKRHKNMNILRKKGEMNFSEQSHRINYPTAIGNSDITNFPQYMA